MLGRQEPRLTFRTLTMFRVLPPVARKTEIAPVLPRGPGEPFAAPKYDRVQHRLAHSFHFFFGIQPGRLRRFVDLCRQFIIIELYTLERELCLTSFAVLSKPKGETAESEAE